MNISVNTIQYAVNINVSYKKQTAINKILK